MKLQRVFLLTFATMFITTLFTTAQNLLIPNGTPGGIGTSPGTYLKFSDNSNNSEGTIRVDGTSYVSYGFWQSGVRRWSLYNHHGGNAHTLYFMNAAGDDKLTLTQSGNLGIGVVTPYAKLHVSGTTNTEQWIEATLDGYASLSFKSNNKKWEWSKRPSSGSDALWLSHHDGSDWVNPAITVWPNGKVGIGTGIFAPTKELTVKGTVYAKEVQVDLSVPGPDYVFEKNYKLQTLAELEEYVQLNKHLPEVPSAKEMEGNGINLSEMNMLLLKKIEELTLHLIDQNKQIQVMANEIDRLKAKNTKP